MSKTGTGGARGGREPFAPTEEWLQKFDGQSSSRDFVEHTHSFAARRARYVALAGRKIDAAYINELVENALVDTLAGILTWEPDRVSLEKHIHDAIKSRSRHDRNAALRMRDIDAPGIEDLLVPVDPEHILDVEYRFSAKMFGELYAHATGDRDVIAIMDAFRRDTTKREAICRETGMSIKRYKAAWERLRRIARKLEDGERTP